MPPSASSNDCEREIASLLKRLHSGCRFVQFEEVPTAKGNNRGGSSRAKGVAISNSLRNATPPDEIHANLGRTLASSYLSFVTGNTKEDKPADEAGVGEKILSSLCCGDDNDADGKSANDRLNYASAAHSYFARLTEFGDDEEEKAHAIRSYLFKQWASWCVRCEELATIGSGGGGVHVLHACLKCYAYIIGSRNYADIEGHSSSASVYDSLQGTAARKFWIQICISRLPTTACEKVAPGGVDWILRPLVESCILGSSKKVSSYAELHEERRVLLREIFMMVNSSTLMSNCSYIAELTLFLSESLASYLKQTVDAATTKSADEPHRLSLIFNLGYEWTRHICDIMQRANISSGCDGDRATFLRANRVILEEVLPQYTPSMMIRCSTMLDMSIIYSSLNQCTTIVSKEPSIVANAVVVYRLGTLALQLQNETDILLLCELILSSTGNDSTLGESSNYDERSSAYNDKMLVAGMLLALGCVIQSRPGCSSIGSRLTKAGGNVPKHSLAPTQSTTSHPRQSTDGYSHLINTIVRVISRQEDESSFTIFDALFDEHTDASAPNRIGVGSGDTVWRRPLSMSSQCSELLIALSLLHISAVSFSDGWMSYKAGLSYLEKYLNWYPRQASRVIPTVVACIKTSLALHNDTGGTKVVDLLRFLTSSVLVTDAHGASLSWNVISSLVSDSSATTIRSTVMGMLPTMCLRNKKLFRRIKDVIGRCMLSQDPLIRISATAALSDLADLDLLRDIEEVIGWVQKSLVDEEDAVVHFALTTLRHLVSTDELEFDLVVRVLEKRLEIDFADIDSVVGLSPLSLEALAILLGEGGVEDVDSDEEDGEDEGNQGPDVTPQTVKAIDLLVQLASRSDFGGGDELSNSRIQRNVFASLARYTPQILGLDAESIRSWDGVSNPDEEFADVIERYSSLKAILSNGLTSATSLSAHCESSASIDGDMVEISNGMLDCVTTLRRALLTFEEDAHGSFLFRGASRSSAFQSKGKLENTTRSVSKMVISSLPSSSDVQDMYQREPNPAFAAAALYSMSPDMHTNEQLDGILSQISEYFSDIVGEALPDPMFRALQICSVMHGMNVVWKTIENAEASDSRSDLFEHAISEIEDWALTYGELAYVAMASLALVVDDSADFLCGLSSIQKAIQDAKDSSMFESDDTKALCTALVAARLCRAADERVTGLVEEIDQSMQARGNQSAAGSAFGLGVIASNCLAAGDLNGSDPSDQWRHRVARSTVSALLRAFGGCLQNEDVRSYLVASVQSDTKQDFADVCSNQDLGAKKGYDQMMKATAVGLSIAMPTITSISSSAVTCLYTVSEQLPWGGGKGLLISSCVKQLNEELKPSGFLDTLSAARDGAVGGSGDALFCVASLAGSSSSKELDFVVKTANGFMAGRASGSGEDKFASLVAMCVTIGDIPGLGTCRPSINKSIKKTHVAKVAAAIKKVACDDLEESKYRNAAAICLGVLSSLRYSTDDVSRSESTQRNDNGKRFDLESLLRAKDGTVMLQTLRDVANSHHHIKSSISIKCLDSLLTSLQPVALPGTFYLVIETILKDTKSDELKSSCVSLLASQLESRRRVGFDGRGFVDLTTRLLKMPVDDLSGLLGRHSLPTIMSSLSDLICQVSTTAGEDVIRNMWLICKAYLHIATDCTVAFTSGLNKLLGLASAEKNTSKPAFSPALLRFARNFVAGTMFEDLSAQAIPTKEETFQEVWEGYVHIRGLACDSDNHSKKTEISKTNLFGHSVCSALALKSLRDAEAWVARQSVFEHAGAARTDLLSILSLSSHIQNEQEMIETIKSTLDVMLVKGSDTLGLYLVAAKVAFWWESRRLHQVEIIDAPQEEVSSSSSLIMDRNLCFKLNDFSSATLVETFNLLLADLPKKLALLCNRWGAAEDVCNRVSRILGQVSRSANTQLETCLREIVLFMNGGT